MIEAVKELSTSEKLVLVQELWDEILSKEGEVQMTDAHHQALDEAEADIKNNPDDGSPWAEVKERLGNLL